MERHQARNMLPLIYVTTGFTGSSFLLKPPQGPCRLCIWKLVQERCKGNKYSSYLEENPSE